MLTNDILERLHDLQVSIDVDGSDLVLRPKSALPKKLIEEVLLNKAAIILHLKHEENTDSFEPWALQEWRKVSIPQWRAALAESIKFEDEHKEQYARWMLIEVLQDPAAQEQP